MQELFPPLSPEAGRLSADFRHIIDEMLPLKAAHRRDLPFAVRELSARLTNERGGGELPYWSSPRLASAYLRWFLPWNLLRLGRLLGGPAFARFVSEKDERPALLDLGSGPLTLPLALWMARPGWRGLPLECLCLDASPRALELGRALFKHLAGENSPWRIVPLRAPLDALTRPAFLGEGRRFRLISIVNALNEMKTDRHAPFSAHSAVFVEQIRRLLAPGGELLCVEPGTRLGGKIVQNLRDQGMKKGLRPVSPCPHEGVCPLQGARSWCHFIFGSEDAPEALTRLAQEAKLPKTNLSLSFVVLRNGAVSPGEAPAGRIWARVISEPFNVPGLRRAARYACSARGLLLLAGAEKLFFGALTQVELPARVRRDTRSGALIVE